MDRKAAKILTIIPARGGSVGIPKKNIRPFAGKPLIAHTIEAAKTASSIDRVIVSTDSEEIAAVARDFGAEVPLLRPKELATSESKIVDAITHLLAQLQKDGYEPTHILLLQPTSPMQTSDDVEKAIDLFFKSNADSLVSVCRTENMLMTKDANDVLTIQNPEMLESSNRQELPAYYKLDGSMIYLVDAKKFLAERSFFCGKLIGYEIERWRAIDLDEPQDFVVGELIFNNRDAIQARIRNFLKES
ncbi:acylneuraminate cytidylyltransferase family protein [Candidatus Kaiserbacteria bacterium]|nr:acylneuraminate cytidylyltransferase family protein [Candidatus Kaiserbacteria bacterium]